MTAQQPSPVPPPKPIPPGPIPEPVPRPPPAPPVGKYRFPLAAIACRAPSYRPGQPRQFREDAASRRCHLAPGGCHAWRSRSTTRDNRWPAPIAGASRPRNCRCRSGSPRRVRAPARPTSRRWRRRKCAYRRSDEPAGRAQCSGRCPDQVAMQNTTKSPAGSGQGRRPIR